MELKMRLITAITVIVALVSGVIWLMQTFQSEGVEKPKEKVCVKWSAVVCRDTFRGRDLCTEWDLTKYKVSNPTLGTKVRIESLSNPTEQYTYSTYSVTSVKNVCKEFGYAD